MAAPALKAPTTANPAAGGEMVARAEVRARSLLLAPAMLIIGVFGILPLFII